MNEEKITFRIFIITIFTWFLVGLLLFIQYFIFMPPLILFSLIFDRRDKKLINIVTHFFIDLFFFLYFTANITYIDNNIKKPDKPRIYMLNHASQFDTFIMYTLPGKLKVFVKKNYTKWPFLGWTIKLSGFIYVDPKKDTLFETSLVEKGVEALKRGFTLIIFPEGTKSKDSNIGRFKTGGFKIAYETKAEIVPVVLDTWNSVRPNGGLWIRDDKIWLKILDSYNYEDYKNYDPKKFAKMLRYKMAEELYKIREERKNTQKDYYRKLDKYVKKDKEVYEKIQEFKKKAMYLP